MKKLAAVLIMLLMFFSAYAEKNMFVEVGPYSYDTHKCTYHQFPVENIVSIYYSWGSVMLSYFTFEEFGMTPSDFIVYQDAYDDWQIAEACIDICLSEESEIGYLYEDHVLAEDYLDYYPPCRIFSADVVYGYGEGTLAGAVFVDESGILFAECSPHYEGINPLESLRSTLKKLFYDGQSVYNPEAAAEAYAAAQSESDIDPMLRFGSAISFDSTGCLTYEPRDDFVNLLYDDKYVDISYYETEELFYTEDVLRYAGADSLFPAMAGDAYEWLVLNSPNCTDCTPEKTLDYRGSSAVLYNCRYAPDEGDDFYISGAIYTGAYGTILLEVYDIFDEGDIGDLTEFRDSLLDSVAYSPEYTEYLPPLTPAREGDICKYGGREIEVPESWILYKNTDLELIFVRENAEIGIITMNTPVAAGLDYDELAAELKSTFFYGLGAYGVNPREAEIEIFRMTNGQPLVFVDVSADKFAEGMRAAIACTIDGREVVTTSVCYNDLSYAEAEELLWQAVDMYYGETMSAESILNERLPERK